MLEGSGRKCELRNVAVDGRSLCSAARSWELPEGPAMAFEEPMGRDISCNVTSHLLLPWGPRHSSSSSSRDMMASLWQNPKEREPLSPLHWGKGTQGERRANPPAHGPQLTPGPLTGSQGYPPWQALAPGVPLTPGGLQCISTTSLSFLRSCNKRIFPLVMRMLRKID